jgi:uncharacterized damage-inducible protein DinB
MTEPWLRGENAGMDPILAAVVHSLQQVREDVREWTRDLREEETWARPLDLAPVGFQLRHITGSTDRLATYAAAGSLSPEQMAALQAEATPGARLVDLVAELDQMLERAQQQVRQTDPATFTHPRGVGRKALPTTVGGLLVHMADHAQRHVGQLIVTARALRASRAD